MREWISLLEDESLEDFSFIDSLTKMLNIKKEDTDSMIEKLSVDELSNLVDATIKNDIDAAKSIISNNTDIEFDLDKNDEDSEDTDIDTENMNDLVMRDKLTAKRSRENHSIDETADSLSLNIGDTVFVDDEEGTVKIPFAPGNTIGVMIDGELQMINKDKVHVREGVLGMTPMPGLRPSADNDLQRMQELAGIRGVDANYPSEIEPANSMDIEEPMHNSDIDSMDAMDGMNDMDDNVSMDEPSYMPTIPTDNEPMGEMEDGADAIESAISDIESHIPNVSISDYKSIVARLKALVSMAENAGRTALAESKKAKMQLVKENEAKKNEIPEDKIMVKQPKENNVDAEGTEVTRKTLLDYIREQEMDNTQTLGADRAAALDTIKNRLGANGNPQAANQAFSKLQSTGKIKQDNGTFTMDSMDDEDFNNAIGQNK